jgi:hypothetical protein
MSAHDADAYADLYRRVERQVHVLRAVIDSLESKDRERHWARHQTAGDLDDAKLVDGMAGEVFPP